MSCYRTHDRLESQCRAAAVADQNVPLPEAVCVLQESQRCFYIADMIGVFGITIFFRWCCCFVLGVVRVCTEPILDRGEACDGEVCCGLENGLGGFNGLCCDCGIAPGTTVDVAEVSNLLLACVLSGLIAIRDRIGVRT